MLAKSSSPSASICHRSSCARRSSRAWRPSGSWTSSSTYSGTLYATSGPKADAPFDASQVSDAAVGSLTLSFSDADHGSATAVVNGVAVTKTITRQPF